MAITTVDGALAGMVPQTYVAKATSNAMVAGRPFTPFYTAGTPAAAVAPSPGMSGAALTSYSGQIPFPAASNNTYLANFMGSVSGQAGILMLCDRLWHNSGLNMTSTTAQSISSVAWPARDRNGSTDGEGVYVGLEISTATGAGTPTLTLDYTNSAGTASRTGTNIVPTVATSGVGTFYPIGLNAGDIGVKSIENFTFSATWTSGAAHLVAYRVIATLSITAGGVPSSVDALTSGFPRCYDDTVPFLLFVPQTTTSSLINAAITFTQG